MTQFDRIVCPIDFSDGSRSALQAAATLAQWYKGALTVLHVHANWPMSDMIPSVRPTEARPAPIGEDERDTMLAAMRRFAALAGVPATLDVEYQLSDSLDAVGTILAAAGSADVIVLGTHGRSGFERLLLGSVAERVLRRATCPVMVVPPHGALLPAGGPSGRRILCPMDFSDQSLAALEYATSLAEEADATLTLLHVIEIPPELRETPVHGEIEVDRIRAAAEAECLRRLRALVPDSVRQSCSVRTRVVEGRAAREIVQAAQEDGDDLIVIGVRGRNALDLMVFGSNTQHVVRSAPCPVLVVHGPAHPSTLRRAQTTT